MSNKVIINISVFLILPILLASLGSSMSSLARVYVSSASFALSILLGAFVTTVFYTQNIENKMKRNILIFMFGIFIPILYITSAYEQFSSGIEEYSEVWSPIYFFTSIIGIVEIMLYVGIYFILFIRLIKLLFNLIIKLVFKPEIETEELSQKRMKYAWIPAEVDSSIEHIALYYDEKNDEIQKEEILVAHIAAPVDGVFYVKFFIDATSVENTAALSLAQKELKFYLIKHPVPDPWEYAKYHCTTAANIYSHMHWSYHDS